MSARLRELVVYALHDRYDVHAVQTERRGHAIALCRDAVAGGYDAVAAFGGDGTVNEAANGLAGTPVALACLPCGSNNVFAKLLGVPADPVDAAQHLLGLADAWAPRRVDLGRVADRWFTFAAGMGLDASVVERVDRRPARKARWREWYFAQSAVTTFLSRYAIAPPRLEVLAGDRRFEGVSVFLQNAEPYTYFKSRPVNVARGASLDSGDLAGAVLTRARPRDVPGITARALAGPGRLAAHPGVAPFARAAEVRVRSLDGRPVPLQVDGDHIGDHVEARFEVGRGALAVVA